MSVIGAPTLPVVVAVVVRAGWALATVVRLEPRPEPGTPSLVVPWAKPNSDVWIPGRRVGGHGP